ncbi:MAG TPA: iron-containing redox enzyme family protein [Candidatus Nitrosocosmicus sp.]
MVNLIDQINYEIERYSLLKHDFYKLWQEGKLTLDHLAGYSKEYFQLVKIVPSLVENTLKNNKEIKYKTSIENTLEDERNHIEPWIKFSSSLKVDKNELLAYNGDNLTRKAIKDLIQLSESSFEEAVALLYAFEKELPKISETKMDGLNKFYGLQDEESNEYFKIHKEVDIYHSKIWENIIKEASQDKKDKMLNAAILSLKAQNEILDSIKSRYVDKNIIAG